jgi:hypothetical protein
VKNWRVSVGVSLAELSNQSQAFTTLLAILRSGSMGLIMSIDVTF